MDKPKEALKRIKTWGPFEGDTVPAIIAWADSIPDDAVCVVWPKGLTRERLQEIVVGMGIRALGSVEKDAHDAIRALAAIAPVRKKRVVNLWDDRMGRIWGVVVGDLVNADWRKVGGPFEIEE